MRVHYPHNETRQRIRGVGNEDDAPGRTREVGGTDDDQGCQVQASGGRIPDQGLAPANNGTRLPDLIDCLVSSDPRGLSGEYECTSCCAWISSWAVYTDDHGTLP